MIPTKSKDLLLKKIREGYTIIEACEASGISKATLYRHLKDPQFKEAFDDAVFQANTKIEKAQKDVEEKNWADLKKIVLKKRS